MRFPRLDRHFSHSAKAGSTRSRQDFAKLGAASLIDIHPEVQDALFHGRPIVALETALVTHGMPFPTNLETARTLESIVRSTGSIPATIGVLGGRIKIGLQCNELERLADERNSNTVKASSRDLMAAIALGKDAGTTCSGTSFLCTLVGIRIFATGGLGGVHRGVQDSMDVSADLNELSRGPVGIVSAGVKSILDIGRTLEYLETLGVPVLSFAKTPDFPAFYSPCSGFKTSWCSDNPAVVAQMLHTQWQLSDSVGALIAAPIPSEFEAAGAEIQEFVDIAIQESEQKGISKSGKDVTPWLLRRVAELTKGKSLLNNIALIENTALIGGKIAVEYSKLSTNHVPEDGLRSCYEPDKRYFAQPSAEGNEDLELALPSPKVAVVGSAAIDITATSSDTFTDGSGVMFQSTSPGKIMISLGGVGRNIAEVIHRILKSKSQKFAGDTLLISAVGDDIFGGMLMQEMQRLGMRKDGLISIEGSRSATCNMILDGKGSLVSGVADMDIVSSLEIRKVLNLLERHTPRYIVLDGNISPQSIRELVSFAVDTGIQVIFEPTSVVKSTSIVPSIVEITAKNVHAPIALVTPNILELAEIYKAVQESMNVMSSPAWWEIIESFGLGTEFQNNLNQLSRSSSSRDSLPGENLSFVVDRGVVQMAIHLLPFFQNIVVKCGDKGILVIMWILGETAMSSGWANMRSDPKSRIIVAKGGEGGNVLAVKHYPAFPLAQTQIANVTGAGDSVVGSIVSSLVLDPTSLDNPTSLDDTIDRAQKAAIMTLQSHLAVSPGLSSEGKTQVI